MRSSLGKMPPREAALRTSPKQLAGIKLKSVKHRLGFYSVFLIHMYNEDLFHVLLGTYGQTASGCSKAEQRHGPVMKTTDNGQGALTVCRAVFRALCYINSLDPHNSPMK